MVSVRQRSADFFVRYAIVDADRQGVPGPWQWIYRLRYATYMTYPRSRNI